jgi:rhodanese-related sulfurtransferase
MKMSDTERVSAPDVRDRTINKSALLVCAYDNDDKFKDFHLEGAISLNEFKAKADGMEKDQEIYFYCA